MASYNRKPLLRSVFGEGSVYQQLDDDEHTSRIHSRDEEEGLMRSQINQYEGDSNQHPKDEDYTHVPESLLVEPDPINQFTNSKNSSNDEHNSDRHVGFSVQPNKGKKRDSNKRVTVHQQQSSTDAGFSASVPLMNRSSGEAHGDLEQQGQLPISASFRANLKHMDPKERALWKWANVENLDNFLVDVYSYFLGSGIYCILLTRAVNMATLLFVVGFSTFLSNCIDYRKLSHSDKLSDIQIPKCMSKMGLMHTFTLWLFALFWFLKLFQYVNDIKRLADMRDFYHYLLGIPDGDMQTISWPQIVQKFMQLREQNNSSVMNRNDRRIDPHIIANRIMRKENYLIAMINKDVLDLSIPLPFFKKKHKFLSKTLEWHISLCIMDFTFNEQGQLRPVFLKDTHRRILSDGLKRRFFFAGVMNIVFAPFIILYLTLLYFFRYFNEYHKDPSSIGTRQYTPLAEWKMREFNELYHLFKRRLNLSYELASRYVNQFPKEKTVTLARFVTFIAGSFAAVLGIVSLIDPDIFLGFEITRDRTVLFYIGLFGTIAAVGRSLIPSETLVFDPETTIRGVAEHTHYLPKEWEGNLRTDWVKSEFSALYDLKLVIILKEVLSVMVAPFILWFSLPSSSDKIVDFFREFSVHVDGMGYVCSFAVFNFDQRGKATDTYKFSAGDNNNNDNTDPRGTYYNTNDGKMLKSYLNFVDNYGDQYQQEQASSRRPVNNNAKGKLREENLENSVMSRFHQMQASSFRYSSGDELNENASTRGLFPTKRRAPFTREGEEEPNNSHMGSFSNGEVLDESSDKEETSEPAEDGGVLGLLNEFYKQAGTGTGNA